MTSRLHPRPLALSALVATLATAALPSPSFAAPVRPLPEGRLMGFAVDREHKVVSYVVVDSIKAHDGLVDFDILAVWGTPKVVGNLTIAQGLGAATIDCKARTWRRNSVALYNTAGVGTDVVQPNPPPSMPIDPGSGMEVLSETLCAGGQLNADIMIEGDAAALKDAPLALSQQ